MEENAYIPQKIEKKWQEKWVADNLYATDFTKPDNYYVLAEFTYPSGDLHVGHWFTWIGADIFARFKRLQGFNVFFPNGFDAFGLPAENAAIKRNIHPQEWTLSNIEKMKKQFMASGGSFTFDHEVITCLPEYYKWNQWIFLKLLEKGLAYRGTTLSNWCESCQTVLANEGVEAGKCWRCSTEVIQKEVAQWFFKITDYADKLLWDNKNKDDWPKPVKEAQNVWIGRKEGAEIEFRIRNHELGIKVFTTRPDTIFGVTYLVLAPEYPGIDNLMPVIENAPEVKEYISQSLKKTQLERKSIDKDKTGVELKGVKAVNPANNKEIPVWIADYVLSDYGTGAIMAVPAHDERDNEFANQYNLPIKYVIAPLYITSTGADAVKQDVETQKRKTVFGIVKHWQEDKILGLEWKKWGWKSFIIGGVEDDEDVIEAAKREIQEETGYKNLRFVSEVPGEVHANFYAGHKNVNRYSEGKGIYFELVNGERDDIDVAETAIHDFVWIDTDKVEDFINLDNLKFLWRQHLGKEKVFTGDGVLINSDEFNGKPASIAKKELSDKYGASATTYHIRDWSVSRQRYWGAPIPVIHCDDCGIVPVPETELPIKLPHDVDFTPKGKSPLATNDDWINVVCPKCNKPARRDGDTMDTFVDSSWYFFRYLSPTLDTAIFDKEIAKRLMPVDIYFGGAEHTLGHTLYSRFITKFFKDIDLIDFDEYALRRINHGIVLGPDGNKMSKSKGNVVNPDDEVKRFGADAVRIFVAFFMPYDGTGPWISDRIMGPFNFLERIWRLSAKVAEVDISTTDKVNRNNAIKKATQDIETIKFNTAIAALMEWSNYLGKKDTVSIKEYKTFLILLAPFAPHITEELWEKLGEENSIHKANWPIVDEDIKQAVLALPIQINGKVRATIEVNRNDSEDDIKEKALAHPDVIKWLENKEPKKIIVVPLKIVSIVG